MVSHKLNTDDLFAEPCSTEKCFMIVSMFDRKQHLISENWLIAEAPKKIKTLTDADIKVRSVDGPKLRPDGRNEFEVVVEASAPAPFTWLEAGSIAVSEFPVTRDQKRLRVPVMSHARATVYPYSTEDLKLLSSPI